MQPWELSATACVEEVRGMRLSPVELVESLLGRVEATDEALLAWVTVDAEGALRSARRLAERLARGGPGGALTGLPVGVKDVIHVAGLRTTASSAVLADYVASEDAHCVTRLRDAEAVILGKLHTAEFACADPAPTYNPWSRAHTPGGSSAGSAVAVAVGTVPVALGTQTGGSTLRPAAYNGIVGLKASYGMISNRGVIPVAWSFDHVGILARSVADATLLFDALSGHDPADPSSSALASGFVPPGGDLDRAPVIGLIRPYFLERCDAEALSHTLEVAARFEAGGAEIRELALPPSFERIEATQSTIMRAEMYSSHREQFAEERALYGPKNAALLEEGRRVTAADYVLSMRERPAAVAALEQALDGVDIALTPATPGPPPADRTTTGDASFQSPWSYAGLPAVALPSGVGANSLPTGVQLVGHRFAEAGLLQVAQWCERLIGFDAHPPCWERSDGYAEQVQG